MGESRKKLGFWALSRFGLFHLFHFESGQRGEKRLEKKRERLAKHLTSIVLKEER